MRKQKLFTKVAAILEGILDPIHSNVTSTRLGLAQFSKV